MKKLIFSLIIVAFCFTANAQKINWITMDQALALQKTKPRPIFMDVYTDWCGPCKMLDKNTFSDKAFAAHISKNFYAVKFNAEGNESVTFNKKKYTNPDFVAGKKGRNSTHQFTEFLNLEGYPTMIVFDKSGAISKNIVGYNTAEQLLPQLK